MIRPTPCGPYCEAGGFHIDPMGAARLAVITHAHSDHARAGSEAYLCSDSCAPLLRERLGANARIESMPFGERRRVGDTVISLHPAGHVLGSAQVRVEQRGEVWVVTGDYKLDADPTCEPFEPVRCDVFVTESTFGMPVYVWPDAVTEVRKLRDWWAANAADGRTSVVHAYPLGKTQRILGALHQLGGLPGPMAVHGSGARMTELYREAGRPMPPTLDTTGDDLDALRGTGLMVCSPMADDAGPIRRLGETAVAAASGWMRIRGVRRGRSIDRGFIVSDHADWPGLLWAIRESGAARVGVTHGFTRTLVRYLRETGVDAFVFPSHYNGDGEGPSPTAQVDEPADAPTGKSPFRSVAQPELPFGES